MPTTIARRLFLDFVREAAWNVLGLAFDGEDSRAEPDVSARFARGTGEQVVEEETRDPQRGCGQAKGDRGSARRVEGSTFDALRILLLDGPPRSEAFEQRQGVGGEELAADLMPRKRVLLEDKHAAPRPRQDDRGSRARRTGADDNSVAGVCHREIMRREGNTRSTRAPGRASAANSRASSAV